MHACTKYPGTHGVQARKWHARCVPAGARGRMRLGCVSIIVSTIIVRAGFRYLTSHTRYATTLGEFYEQRRSIRGKKKKTKTKSRH